MSEIRFMKVPSATEPGRAIYKVLQDDAPIGYVKRSASGGWCYTPYLDEPWTRIPGGTRASAGGVSSGVR